MNPRSRRQFLRQSLSAAALAASPWPALRARTATRSLAPIPPHRALELDGIHAYADAESVPAGGAVRFFASSTVPSRVTICRLGPQVDDPAGDEVLATLGVLPPRAQAIHPGSYIHVQRGLPSALARLTIECWVRPWALARPQCVVSQSDSRQPGFAFCLLPQGALRWAATTDDSPGSLRPIETRPGLVPAQQWAHLAAVCEPGRIQLYVNGEVAGSWPFPDVLVLPEQPLRWGASGRDGQADHFLDADLAMPVLYRQALGPEQVRRRYQARGLELPPARGLLGCWPLTEERGQDIADISSSRRHGRIVNLGTWMIGGPSFDPDVPRFGNYDPVRDIRRGHGLRLASDDLYDCRWVPVLSWRVPAGARSGLHVARFEFRDGDKPALYHVMFNVRRRARPRRPSVLVLASTHTWRAYNGTPFGNPGPDLHRVWGTGGVPNRAGDPPAYCFYRTHAAGQGTFQIGLRVPWPVASPYVLYGGRTRYSHLARADRFFHAWLERQGYSFDVITDQDFHRDPALPRNYPVFAINGHSEYWSVPMFNGLQDYLAHRGQVVCLSGNTLFWRVSYDPDFSVLECRKVDAPGEQLPHERRGECWHSHDGLRGGLMRECGFPGWKLLGLETLGWNNQDDAQQFGAYTVEAADHFLFTRPVPVGSRPGDPIGQRPDGGLPRANGHEIDVRLSTLRALQEGPVPSGAVLPEDPPGIVRLANGIIPWKRGGAAFDFFFRPIKPTSDQGGEMIFWDRADGGKVFHAGSIGAGWALQEDPKFQRLLKNVLHHFGVPEPASLPV